MLQAEEVARAKVTSIKQEAENDTRTIEDPPNPRRVSMTRTAGLPPQAPKFQPPDLHETHGPILPVERKHQFPEKPPVRVESTAKDDFKFPVMVEDGKHSCTEVFSLHPAEINSAQRCFVSSKIILEYYKQLHIQTNHCI